MEVVGHEDNERGKFIVVHKNLVPYYKSQDPEEDVVNISGHVRKTIDNVQGSLDETYFQSRDVRKYCIGKLPQ